MEIIPHTAVELIQLLDKDIPHRCIAKSEDVVEAQRYAGKRELVDHLLNALESTRVQALTGTV